MVFSRRESWHATAERLRRLADLISGGPWPVIDVSSVSQQQRNPLFIRIVSGIIGTLGFAAIALNALQDGGLEPDLGLFASFFAGFIFLYFALFGKYPWDGTGSDE